MSLSVSSPITGSNRVTKVNSIPARVIRALYKEDFNYEVIDLLHGADTIDIYRCEDTGFEFYYPFNIDGDGKFYEHLSQFPGYYTPWKWEHEQAIEWIKPGDKVLEPGCAYGSFLQKVKAKGAHAVGLELNDAAAQQARTNGLDVQVEPVQEFAKTHLNQFDVVCSFQVVEHIAELRSFLEAQIDCLKPGGKLIISVPNNDNYIFKYNLNYTGNLPPHHMGRWNEAAFRALPKFFPLQLEAVYKSPIGHEDYLDTIRMLVKARVPLWLYPLARAISKRVIMTFFKSQLPIKFGRIITVVYSKK